MQIIDLDATHESAWLHCLEHHADEIFDGVQRKRQWYQQVADKGLVVKLALDADGEAVGMVQLVPVELVPVQGEGHHFVQCIWVHGHKRGLGNRQGHGIGTALLQAAEDAARRAGASGLAAWGMALPFWMKASWFKRHGYRTVDRVGLMALVWKPFVPGAEPPRWVRDPETPDAVDGQVTVTCFDGGWCTLQSANCERARRAAVVTGAAFRLIDTSDPQVATQWRQDYGVYVDAKRVGFGAPLTEAKIRKAIVRRPRRH